MKRFDRSFFLQPTLTVAKALLGARLVTTINGESTAGMIVEVEAYGGDQQDAACHAHRGLTPRNQVMFLEGGHCYTYFIYGVHWCVNVVTEGEGIGSAVLIRAIEPLEGIDLMRVRRGGAPISKLTNGPGKVCRALGIDRSFNGEALLSSTKIQLEPDRVFSPLDLETTARIGISKSIELPWRFYVRDNRSVSLLPKQPAIKISKE